MKIDIKSFLIGVLTTVNLFLLMGFDDHKEENQNGRYQLSQGSGGNISILDTKNGYMYDFGIRYANVNQWNNKMKELSDEPRLNIKSDKLK